VANSAITADVAVSAAAFAIATRKHLWDATTLGNGPTERFLEWKDWADAVLVALQALVATGGETALITRTTMLADSQDEGDTWSGVTKAIEFDVPVDEVLVGVALTIGDEWVSGGGADTDSVSVTLGINSGDTDRAAETVELIGESAGAVVVWPAGAGLGEVLGAGSWELLFTADGLDPSLGALTSGTVTATVLTVPL
jgi:hypothetical protein